MNMNDADSGYPDPRKGGNLMIANMRRSEMQQAIALDEGSGTWQR